MGIQYRHPFNEGWFIPNDGEWGNTASWRSYPPHAGVDYNVVGGSSGKTIRAIAAMRAHDYSLDRETTRAVLRAAAVTEQGEKGV